MTSSALRTLVVVHGWLAWGAFLPLVGALVLFGSRRSIARGLLGGSMVCAVAAFVTGAWLHAPFQSRLRQKLFLMSTALGWLFERKEHVAFGALALTGCAVFAAIGERIARAEDEAVASSLARAQKIAIVGVLVFEAFAIAVSYATSARVPL
ncbi:MAG: hypothetical protein U0441_33310 [Polyangiaceae bacterium]